MAKQESKRVLRPAEYSRRSSRYVAALDGLRAFAVLIVIFYHMGLGWAPGGLMGVTVFFVISGYLINGLLVAEHESSGRISLSQFWLRRVRRIIPAVLLAIAGTLVLCALLNPTLFDKARADLVPSLLFYNNWWQVFRDISYFEAAGAPSPLTHYWSLAIEEQFYIVWPLLLVLLFKSKIPKKGIAVIVGVLAVASFGEMALLYSPTADPSRIYYGTDTRAGSLLVGVLLALVWPSTIFGHRRTQSGNGPSRLAFNVLGVVAVAVLVAVVVFTNSYTAFPYYGGIVLVSVATAVLIAVLVVPHTWVARLFQIEALVWIGKRSYGMYLWHYPIILATTSVTSTIEVPWWVRLSQLVIIFAVSDLSYRFVESPIRSGALRRWWQNRRSGANGQGGAAPERTVAQRAAAVGTVVVCALLACGAAAALVLMPPVSSSVPSASSAKPSSASDASREVVVSASTSAVSPQASSGSASAASAPSSASGSASAAPAFDSASAASSASATSSSSASADASSKAKSSTAAAVSSDASSKAASSSKSASASSSSAASSSGSAASPSASSKAASSSASAAASSKAASSSASASSSAASSKASKSSSAASSKASKSSSAASESASSSAAAEPSQEAVEPLALVPSIAVSTSEKISEAREHADQKAADIQAAIQSIFATSDSSENEQTGMIPLTVSAVQERFESLTDEELEQATLAQLDVVGQMAYYVSAQVDESQREAERQRRQDTYDELFSTAHLNGAGALIYDPLLIGDSVAAGCENEFYRTFPNGHSDAQVSRNIWESPYPWYAENDQVGQYVVFCLGTNNAVVGEQIDEMMATVASDKKVILVNVRCPRDWEAQTNEAIAAAPKRWSNIVEVIDWYGESAGHDEWFYEDGIHLNEDGAKAYIGLIQQAIERSIK